MTRRRRHQDTARAATRPSGDERTERWIASLRTSWNDGATWPMPAQPHWYSAPPPAGTQVIPLPESRAVMTVAPPAAGGPGPTPQGVRAAVYIETEAGVLEDEGKLYDADAAAAVARKAARRLRGKRQPWEPAGGWNHGWAADLPWEPTS